MVARTCLNVTLYVRYLSCLKCTNLEERKETCISRNVSNSSKHNVECITHFDSKNFVFCPNWHDLITYGAGVSVPAAIRVTYLATPFIAFLLCYTRVTARPKCTGMGNLCLLASQQIHNTFTGHTGKLVRAQSIRRLGHRLDHRRSTVQFPAGAKSLSLLQNSHTGCGAQRASYSKMNQGLLFYSYIAGSLHVSNPQAHLQESSYSCSHNHWFSICAALFACSVWAREQSGTETEPKIVWTAVRTLL